MKNLFLSFSTLCLMLTSQIAAQSPYLDGNFGLDGRFSIYFDTADLGAFSRIYATAVQADGRIVGGGLVSSWAAGFLEYKVALTRTMPNGLLDGSFGYKGRVVLNNEYIRNCRQITIQPDAKILVSGWGWGTFIVVRLLPDGTLDSTFGTGGVASVAVWTLPDERFVTSMTLLPNGKILLTGRRETGPDYGMITQLKADGKQDLAFGNFGAVKFNAGSVMAAIQSDGKILVASCPNNQGHVKIERFDAQGDKDMTFNDIIYSPLYYINGFFSLPDGKFMVLSTTSPLDNPIAVRFNADGSLDNTFGSNGVGTIAYGNPIPPYSGVLQPDGKLLVFGGEQGWGFITRFKQDGTLDSDFGANGFILPETNYEVYYQGCLQPDGKIIAPGRYINGLTLQMGSILRYMADPFVGLIDSPTPISAPLLYPNPITDVEIVLEYEILQASTIRIDLLDINGTLLYNLIDAPRPSGKSRELLRLPLSLGAGSYLLNVQSEQGNSVVKCIVQR